MGTDNSQTAIEPTIEVAVSVDASGAEDEIDELVVVIDGKPYRPKLMKIVNAGRENDSRANLRTEAWDNTREGSQAFTELLDLWYRSAEELAKDDYSDDFVHVAERVQPDVTYAAKLDPSQWFAQSAPLTNTRKAAQAAVAVRVFHTCPWQTYGPRAVETALTAYRTAVKHPKHDGFDVVLMDLLTDLRHLAEAYGIRLESGPARNAALAWDLREVLAEIRTAARGPWAELLATTGKTLADVEYQAFNNFVTDCTTDAALVF